MQKKTGKKSKAPVFKGKEFSDLDISTSGKYARSDEVGQATVNMPRVTRARAKKAGFDTEHSWFHGTKSDIEAFSSSTLGGSTGAGSAKLAHFFSSSQRTIDHDHNS